MGICIRICMCYEWHASIKPIPALYMNNLIGWLGERYIQGLLIGFHWLCQPIRARFARSQPIMFKRPPLPLYMRLCCLLVCFSTGHSCVQHMFDGCDDGTPPAPRSTIMWGKGLGECVKCMQHLGNVVVEIIQNWEES